MSKKTHRISSAISGNKLTEMVYDEKSNKTEFAVYDAGEVEYLPTIDIHGTEVEPLSPSSDLVRKKVILFPSEAHEFGSEELLVQEIQKFIHKYLEVTPLFEKIASYYVLFSWVYDKFNEVPYLRAIGDYGTGKTRFLQVIGSLCYKPIFAGGATTVSPIFRILDGHGGTLILDEADFRFSDKTSDMIKILNNGYARGFPVLRSEGQGTFEVKTFEVFSPKVVATREKFRDRALESRFLVEEMRERKLRGNITLSLTSDFYEEALNLRNKLLYWRFLNRNKNVRAEDKLDDSVHPRLRQIALPLLSVVSSESVQEEMREFVRSYNTELVADRSMSWEADALRAFLELIKRGDTSPTVKSITEEYNFGRAEKESITSRKMGWILKDVLRLKKTHRSNDGIHVPLSENQEQVDLLKSKYGVNDVHDVNNEEDEEIWGSHSKEDDVDPDTVMGDFSPF